jgi:hypothetical protein
MSISILIRTMGRLKHCLLGALYKIVEVGLFSGRMRRAVCRLPSRFGFAGLPTGVGLFNSWNTGLAPLFGEVGNNSAMLYMATTSLKSSNKHPPVQIQPASLVNEFWSIFVPLPLVRTTNHCTTLHPWCRCGADTMHRDGNNRHGR